MIHIAVVEDEESYADQLNQFIRQFAKEKHYEIRVTRFTDGDEIVEKYSGDYDIILMDIQMRFMDGMTAAERIRLKDRKVVIMFITNMTQYAIRGYQVDALDYVLKPVSYFAFAQKLERAIGRIEPEDKFTVALSLPDGVVLLDAREIYYIESEGHNLHYVTKQGEYRTRQKISDAEEILKGHGFFRSNKGYLVNLSRVEGVRNGCCIVHGEELLISRARKNDFMAALAEGI
jgi:DNA-binding LytR/AlgR family response regulator